ncbi:MAG TPA: hypothetical protein VGL72_30670 [Bryobacteraceae bacterium]|jgi:hypothetical protein
MKTSLLYGISSLVLCARLTAQDADPQLIRQLMLRLEASERRIQVLEEKLRAVSEAPPITPQLAKADPAPAGIAPSVALAALPEPQVDAHAAMAQPADPSSSSEPMQGHNMEIPGGGPTLKIRGFFDFNFGTGSIANPLLFPVISSGCQICGNPPTPAHTGFQAGEFDLFITSKLSNHLSFVGEVIMGADNTNAFSLDIERYQLTYTHNDYFSISGGRFHTSIGYYNTAFHHGNWFSTAEGRPIMYLFEDSGGILPVHTVGLTMTGLVPHSGSLGLHWIAEIGNGRSSTSYAAEPVQNFYSDRGYKATNFAAYVKPEWLHGLQIGGSYYHDHIEPRGVPHVAQNVYSAYAVYNTPSWEILNEAVLLENHLLTTPVTYKSPMAYSQISRGFGIYRPYFRYQYVNSRGGDPVNILQGLYYGPSVGIRIDYSEYAAFKLQYNRLFKGNLPAANGLNAQVAFTF